MQQIEVKVENDHIQRITTAKPIAAISELIWNAYDADAREVKVELEEGQLTKLGVIRIVDDGKPRGMVLEVDDPIKIRVWAKTWGEIIQEAEGRLTFYKRRLEYQANDREALRYLRTINSDFLSDEVKERISALDAVAAE